MSQAKCTNTKTVTNKKVIDLYIYIYIYKNHPKTHYQIKRTNA